ncbi:uncharacterized protein LOC142346063 [Convolutriloba macropyga]|uniref:uncharacterized protein LOC142346063 n=1 Tax=Convolutriloba macropyga TaxID=536237 RepID=UPI003F526043
MRPLRRRRFSAGEQRQFKSLIEPVYTSFNFFSLDSFDRGSCCDFQVIKFTREGQEKAGLSAQDYYWKVTDFSSANKNLNWIYAVYEQSICSNVILQIGFGPGSLIIQGHIRHQTQYIFPFQEGREPYIISSTELESVISYEWFKFAVICGDQPWVCEEFESDSDWSTRRSSIGLSPISPDTPPDFRFRNNLDN